MVINIETSDECCNEHGGQRTSESSTATESVSTGGSAITTKPAFAWQLNLGWLTGSNVGKRVMTDGGKGTINTPKDGERGYETDVRGSAEDTEHQNVAVDEIIDTVAVGVVATEENTDRVVRTVLRAIDRGYDVFVTYYNTPELESVRLAEKLGATIVHPGVTEPDEKTLQNGLAVAADNRSLSGILFQSESCDRIDFDRTERRFADASASVVETVAEIEKADVLLGIPAYNEEGTIADVVEEARQHVDQVIVIDDGSSDATVERAREAGAEVIEHEQNRGYGAAIKTIFEEARRRSVTQLVILDGDGQHNPADIPELVSKQQESAVDIVIGSRFSGDGQTDMPAYRRFGLWVVNVLTNMSMGIVRPQSRVGDTQSGFRVYSKRAVETLADDASINDRMSASTDILYCAHKNDLTISEVGTTIQYDVENASSHSPLSHGLLLVNNILKTFERERPVTLLGVPGLLVTFLGVGFGYWTFLNYMTTSSFPIGLAIVSTLLTIIGILSCFTSIILHSLNTHRDF
jgi:glycosyltransferase involved in cell wall biosynthesis